MWRVICKMLCFSFRIVSLCNKCRKSDLKVINAGPRRSFDCRHAAALTGCRRNASVVDARVQPAAGWRALE